MNSPLGTLVAISWIDVEKSQFCVKSERNKIKLLIPRGVISLFGKSCQAAIAIFPPLSSAACRPGTAASLVPLVSICSVLCHSATLRVWAPVLSHDAVHHQLERSCYRQSGAHTRTCEHHQSLILPPEGDYWLLCFLSLPFHLCSLYQTDPFIGGWVFSTKSKRGRIWKRWSIWNY